MSVLSSSAAPAYNTLRRTHNPQSRHFCPHSRLRSSPTCRSSHSHSAYVKDRALSTRQPIQNSRKRRFCVSAGASALSKSAGLHVKRASHNALRYACSHIVLITVEANKLHSHSGMTHTRVLLNQSTTSATVILCVFDVIGTSAGHVCQVFEFPSFTTFCVLCSQAAAIPL